MINRITKTMQITTDEFKKCKQGQEFKIDMITIPKDKPIPPVLPIIVDPIPKPPKQPTLREMFTEFRKDVITRLDDIDIRLDEQGNLLHKVIKLNNLKTE